MRRIGTIARMTLFVLLICGTATAQTKPQQWHGIPAPSPSTIKVPYCALEGDPDGIGFIPCSYMNTRFSRSYLEKRQIAIQPPDGYHVRGPGKGFYVLAGAFIGATVFDEEEAQRLIHEGPQCGPINCVTYREANPLLGQTRYQAYGILSAVILLDYIVCRKQARYQRLRSDVGLPEYRTRVWSIITDYRTPFIFGILEHGAFGMKQSHKTQ